MKRNYLLINTLAVWLATITNAYAATTTKVFSSSILVVVFLGFCALVVVVNLAAYAWVVLRRVGRAPATPGRTRL